MQSASNLLNRYQGSDTNLYQGNLEAQALMAQQQALGMGIQGLSSQTALDLLQVSLYDPSPCNKSVGMPLPYLTVVLGGCFPGGCKGALAFPTTWFPEVVVPEVVDLSLSTRLCLLF